jgi:hypothetical protein
MSPFSRLSRSLADFQAATSPEAFEEAAAKVVLPESPGNPTPPPTPIPTPTNSPVAPPGVTTKGTKKNVGAIVGGVVGGFCGLALIAGAVAFVVYQRKKGKRISSALLSSFRRKNSFSSFGKKYSFSSFLISYSILQTPSV